MTEWAAKVLEGVPRWTINEGRGAFLSEAEVLDAIAKLADGGGLVERATAALEGVTGGPWAVEYKDGTTRLLMGNEVAMCDEKYYPWTPENDKDWHFIAFTRQWVPEAAAHIAALTAQNQTWQRNSRETFDAMVAMRNSINEHLPMPSLESDLLQGPENSVFCAAVADAVVQHVAALTAERDEAECEKDRLAEINRNLCNSHNILLVDGSNWQARAEAAEAEAAALTAQVGVLETALTKIDVGEGWAAITARAALKEAGRK